MSMRYHVHHCTDYGYAAPVQTARHLLHLAPRACEWQRVETQAVRIEPEPVSRVDCVDAFGNPVTRIELSAPHQRLVIDSEMTVAVGRRPWAATLAEEPDAGPGWEAVRDLLGYTAEPLDEATRAALMMRFESPGVRVKRELELYAEPSFAPGHSMVGAVYDLMQRVHDEFAYDPDATDVGTGVLEVLEKKRGVCQDFAHLMIGCLRATGLAARYVSGYMRTDPPEGQPRLVGADASHAWVAAFVPALGWVEFDPTNGCLADERYLVLGWGRDFGDVSPVRGVIQGGGEHALAVGVTVTPLDEDA
jgi:transglutaminase-like putative cysteine protease